MRIEADFVVSLACGDFDRAAVAAYKVKEWGLAGDLAARHQVESLCWWRLRHGNEVTVCSPSPSIPDWLSEQWHLAYLHHRLRNESLVRNLTVVHDSLAARGIKAMYLKGPWLALCAWPDAGTRPIGDIDLCVGENDYLGTVAALREAGYAPVEPLPQTYQEALRKAHFGRQIRFMARGRRPLELHFRLVNLGPPGVEENWVWHTARDLIIGGRILRVPGPEAMLLHLLLHANQHGFTVLRLLFDIRWALQRDAAIRDELEVIARIRQLRFGASAYHALLLARDLTEAAPVDSLLLALRPHMARRAVFSLAWNLAAARRLALTQRHNHTESPRFYLLEMGSLREKAQYLTGIAGEAGGAGGILRDAWRHITLRTGFSRSKC
jgi:hypothetical protein